MKHFRLLTFIALAAFVAFFIASNRANNNHASANSTTAGTAFVSTGNATVANTTAEGTIIGAGAGTLTIPANYLQVGAIYELRGEGIFSTPLTPGNATVRIKLNSTVLAQTTATGSLLTANSNNYGCTLRVLITVRSIGTNGTVIINGAGDFTLSPSAGTNARLDFNNGGVPVTINTTVPLTLNVTAQWSNAQTNQTITGTQAVLTQVN